MSRQIVAQSEIRDLRIAKDTLEQMGISYREASENILSIKRSYRDIVINCHLGQVSYDNMYQAEVNRIQQTYMANFFKDRAIREGNQCQQTVNENGEIVITITH